MDQREIVMLYISTGMQVLSGRVLMVTSIVLAFALFGWTMWSPDPYRLGAACAFSVLVFWPVTRMDRALKAQRDLITPKE